MNRVATSPWRDFLSVRGMHFRYYRRVIECRDGLVRISPHLAQRGVQEDAPVTVFATHLQSALQAPAEAQPAASKALAIAMPDDDSLDADVRQLVALSDALATPA